MSVTSTSHPSNWKRERSPAPAEEGDPRSRGPRRISVRSIVATVVGVAVIAAVAAWVSASPVFAMRTITVSGNHHLTSGEVADLAGLRSSTNVFWLSGGAVARRLESDPWVLTASVGKVLPSTIHVRLVERVPVAVTAGTDLLVSADGVLLGPAGPGTRLPAVAVPAGARVGQRLALTLPSLSVARTLPATLRGMVQRVASEPSGLTLVLRGGVRAIYGDASDALAKGAALQALLSWARSHGVTPVYIDVRIPEAPALLPSGLLPSVSPTPAAGSTTASPSPSASPRQASPSPSASGSPRPSHSR